jgi:hypothetical protein
MTIPTIEANEADNKCCPELTVAECANTKEHRHLICGFSEMLISNKTARELCIANFKECVNMTMEAN